MNDQNDAFPACRPAFDDKPIGNKTKFEIPEYADTHPPNALADHRPPEPVPLAKRVASKLWKVKKEALDELLGLAREDPAAYQPFEQQTLEFITFNHASVQQRGLKLALLYLSSGRQLEVEAKTVIKTIISKCMTSDKEDIKYSCEQILFWYMDNRYEELLLNELNEELLNKNPKIIAISILFIATLLHNYGIKRLKFLEKFAKHLELLSTPPKPMAKAQTIEFYKEVYRWMGDNTFKEFKIHMEVKDELTKFSKEYVKVAMEIKRGLKREGLPEGKKVLYDMNAEAEENTEPLDVLCMYTPRWVDETLEIQKWKDKKAVLDEFIKKTKVAAIVPRENTQFISLIKRLLLDNNINLAQCGFLITQNLSKGLKKNFTLVAKNIQTAIFTKLRDGKPVIVEAAQTTLKSLMHCLTLQDLMEDIKAGLEDKAPNMRKQVLKFLHNFASNKTDQKVIGQMRNIVDRIVKMTEDGSAQVRVQALELLCKLKITHEMRFFGDKLKPLDQKKLAAVKSAMPSQAEEKMQIEQDNYVPQPVVPMVCESIVVPAKSMRDLEKELKSRNKMEDVSAKSSNIQNSKANSLLQSQLNDLSSQSEPVRLNSYQQIASKSPSFSDKNGIYFTLRSKATKESSPSILKLIIQIIKKYSPTEIIDLQSLQFLCMHDWRKCKHLLTQFIQSNRFSQAAQDYIRNNSQLFSTASVSKIPPPAAPTTTASGVSIKQLMIELQNLIPKMSSPVRDIKIDAADQALRILELLPKVNSESDLTATVGWNQDLINQFFNVAKFRLSEPEYEIPAKYSRVLSQMVHKGIAFKNKSIRLVLPSVFAKAREGHPEIKSLMSELAQNNPVFIFSVLLGEIALENTRDVPLEFIIENNELFIRNADLKAYMGPLLHLIFCSPLDNRLKNNCEKLLDQIVELCGENVLQAEVKKAKIGFADAYLAKFNIAVSKAQPVLTSRSQMTRCERQKADQDFAWPITPTPSHILKLINAMVSLKQPMSLLATPLPLGTEQIGLLQTLDGNFLNENADLLFKWIYWRTIIDPQDMVQLILDFAAKVVISIQGELHEAEVSILLSSLTNCLKRFHRDCLGIVYEIQNRVFRKSGELREKCFLFWVNFLHDDQGLSSPPVDEILQIFMHCYSDLLDSELVSLARHPAVIKNDDFCKFLQTRCDPEKLNVSGFSRLGVRVGRQAVQAETELKPLLSDLGGPENMVSVTAEERRNYMYIFQKLSSDQMVKKINEIAAQVEPGAVAETHLKIIYSVVVPFMKREISTINMFSYMKEVGRFMHATEGLAKVAVNGERSRFALHLKDLTRVLIYFLIDLDENTIDNKEQITRVVNRIILLLLEHNDSRHLLEVLFLLLRTQMALNLSTKILHLLVKCIGKVCNNNSFNLKQEDNLSFVLSQSHALLAENAVPLDHTIVKSLRNIYNDIAANHSLLDTVIHKFQLNEPLHPTLAAICQDIRPQQNENLQVETQKDKEGKEISAIKAMGTTVISKLVSIKKGEV